MEPPHVARARGPRPERTLFKFILAHVVPKAQRRFSQGQLAWAALSEVPGFRGQFGGFSEDGHALVFGLWRDQQAYARFMERYHDDIAARAKQREAYSSLEIETCREVMPMPGVYPNLELAMPHATHLRWTDCRVRRERIDAFIERHERAWRPGMATTGMLGGAFWQTLGAPERFLVLTLWPGEAAHVHDCREVPLGLRRIAAVDADLDTITGGLLRMEPTWTVTP